MKKILCILVWCMCFAATQVHALSCEVSYKARKINVDRYIFTDIPDPIYKTGKVRGKGGSLGQCKKNALKPLQNKGWKITDSSAPKKI